MSNQITKVDLIPNGELSVCNVSQFDNGRVLPFEILENKEAYNIPSGITVELHCRKADGNIVTLAADTITDNKVTFISTTQLTACYGKNLCEISLLGEDDYLIGSANFYLEVEKSPTLGGITSTSEIHNLKEQIEEITTEIVGENYYNKTEVDNKLSLKANAADVYTKSQTDTLLSAKANSSDVYTKGQVDTALADKADVSDLPDMDLYYTKTATDALLASKADASTTTAALATKADKSDTYTKEQVDALIDSIFPTLTATGAIASFTTALSKPLVSVTAAAGATTVTACGVNLWDEEWELGSYDNSTGEKIDSFFNIRNKNFIIVKPGMQIYICMPSNAIVLYYDENKDFLRIATPSANTTLTIPDDVYFINFRMGTGYGTTYTNDISLNYPATDTTYHTYSGQTVPVTDATTLTTQAGVNNVYTDNGDVTVQYKYMSM